jgi:transcriptional coactivator p15 (PC4)
MSSVLASWGPQSFETRLSIVEFKGSRFVDVRKHYGEKPTRKGIMLRKNQLEALVEALAENNDDISDWFEGELEALNERIDALHTVLARARIEEATKLHDTEVGAPAPAPSTALFNVDFEGGKAVVTVNPRHSIATLLHEAIISGDGDQAERILAAVLQATFHSVALGNAGDGSLDLDAAEQHAHMLGVLLSQVQAGVQVES